jgi:raffinose/stachyose/melibiose transport system substrate-binding protein
MRNQHPRRLRLLPVVSVAVGALALAGCSAGSIRGGGSGGSDSKTLTFLADDSEGSVALANGLAKGFEATNKGVTVKVETRPQGSEGDNVVKTRLSTGDMDDVFMYNTGSLLQALDPAKNLVPVDDLVTPDKTEESFLQTVKSGSHVYGAPFGTAQAGAVLYNKKVFAKAGVQVPKTWDEFMANNAKLKAAGVAPVIQTYKDTWTSQLFVLGDFHNVAATDPSWAQKYTKNQAHYSEQPAIEGFQRLEEVHKAGYENKDFASATLVDGLDMLATGKGAQYPILTGAAAAMYSAHPEAKNDVGVFPIPGNDAASNGLTIWTGGGVYIPKSTTGDKLSLAKKFIAFANSRQGCDAQTKAYPPTGPYFTKSCSLPAGLPAAVTEIQKYFDDGDVTPALEFASPVKGPALEQICVEVGSGISSAQKGAKLYDEDVKKQAQQLNLPGWA